MRGIRFVDLRGILSSWWTRAALRQPRWFCHEDDAFAISALSLSLSLFLSIYLSLWSWSAAWWSGGLLTNGREKGGGGEWWPAAAEMVV